MAIQSRPSAPPAVEREAVLVAATPAPSPTAWQLIVRTVVLISALIAAVWIGREFSDLLLNVFMALVITAAVKPAIDRMDHVMPRILAIAITCLVLLGLIFGVFAMLVPIVIAEATHFGRILPNAVNNGLALLPDFAQRYIASLGQSLSFDELMGRFAAQAGAVVGGVGGALQRMISTIGAAAGNVLLVFVIVCFLLGDPSIGQHSIRRLVPAGWQSTADDIIGRLARELGQWARAQVVVALLFGSSLGLGLWLMGVPYALSLGAAAALLEFVPYIGGLLVTILALASAATVSPLHVLGVIVLNLTISLIEGHILYPKFVGDRVGLHPVIVLIAFLVAVQLFGVIGVLLAVPLTIVVRVLYDHWVQPGPLER